MAESPDTNPIPLPHESLLPADPFAAFAPEPFAREPFVGEPFGAGPVPPTAPPLPEAYERERGPWEAPPWVPAADPAPLPEAAPPDEEGPVARRGLPRPEELLVWGAFTTLLAIVLTVVMGSGVLRAAMLGGLGAAATGVLWAAARFGGAPPGGGTGGGGPARRVRAVANDRGDRSQDRIVWIDCEMTGLDLHRDALIEVAALVTDSELQVLGEGVDVVIKPPAETLDSMLDVVRTMHTSSGLLDELEAGLTLEEAEKAVLDYVRTWVPEPRKAPLAGNSVGTDRGFLARDMQALDDHLHYRIVDVSSIKELARRWYPRVYFASPSKNGGHRALADIRESIEELKYYREILFVPRPGPDTDTARAAAAKYVLPATPPETPAT